MKPQSLHLNHFFGPSAPSMTVEAIQLLQTHLSTCVSKVLSLVFHSFFSPIVSINHFLYSCALSVPISLSLAEGSVL